MLLIAFLFPAMVWGQRDVILTRDGNYINCRIIDTVGTVIAYLPRFSKTDTISISKSSVAEFRIAGQKAGVVMEPPSVYLQRAADYRYGAILVAMAGGAGSVFAGKDAAPYIAGGAGLLALIFELASTAQINNAGRAMENIQIKSNGVTIKF